MQVGTAAKFKCQKGKEYTKDQDRSSTKTQFPEVAYRQRQLSTEQDRYSGLEEEQGTPIPLPLNVFCDNFYMYLAIFPDYCSTNILENYF